MRGRAIVISLVCLLTSVAFGGPNTIAYQGNLLNSNGTPITDGDYRMRFVLFNVPSSGPVLWSEEMTSVTVKNGLFSATLGGTPAPFGSLFADNFDLWLQLVVDLNRNHAFEANENFLPRQKLAGAAWAMDADTLDTRHASEFSLSTHNHDTTYWRLAGNAGTTSGTHFLGTTDNQPLDFRVNNVRALRLEPNAQSPNLIGGYRGNFVASGAVGATIAGGGWSGQINRVTSSYGTIAGGKNNTVTSGVATIGGGEHNAVGWNWSTIGGGFDNEITSYGATIGGGIQSRATGLQSTIAGGAHNKAGGYSSTVGGGRINQASGHYAAIAGGDTNTAGGFNATICGGWDNVASGTLATVAGGAENIATGDYSFVAGHMAEANHKGTFVWGDSTPYPSVKSTGENQFIVRAGGGMILTPRTGPLKPEAQLHIALDSNASRPHLFLEETQTSDFARLRLATTASSSTQYWDVAARPGTFNIYYRGDQQNILQLLPDDATNLLMMRNGARLTNGGAWTNGSDRATKSNFAAVDSHQVLEQVAALPIQTWNYRSEPETARHMGPMAQDFYAAFSLGDSDKTIATVDADGVALAAIQGLYRMVQQKDAQIAALKAQSDSEISELKARLATLETTVKALAQQPAAGK